jgi:hypothetical protein
VAVQCSCVVPQAVLRILSAEQHTDNMEAFEQKMKADGCTDAAIAAFKHNYEQLLAGADGMVPEATISPVAVRYQCVVGSRLINILLLAIVRSFCKFLRRFGGFHGEQAVCASQTLLCA